jgi:hypothetical protein
MTGVKFRKEGFNMAENEKEMKVAKDMMPADLAVVPFVSIKGNDIITSIL